MTALKATPTEYKGVRYRSKSEAMFARHLELCNQAMLDSADHLSQFACGFIYEDPYFSIDGHAHDFHVWQTRYSVSDGMTIQSALFEYKPSKPTIAYCNKFFANVASLRSRGKSIRVARIFYGSIYSRADEIGVVYEDMTFSESDWMAKHREAIQSTRFDLEQSA